MQERYLDQNLLIRKLEIIEEELSFLKGLNKLSWAEFKRDLRNIKASQRALQNAIQALIDAGSHIVVSLNLGKPGVYEDIPKILFESGVISKSFMEKFNLMVRFRNFLVHEYDRVDAKKIYEIMKKDIPDIEEGMRLIKKFIKMV